MRHKWLCCVVGIVLISFLFSPLPGWADSRVPILVYHSIDYFEGHGNKELYVTPKNFEQQMAYLKSHGFTLLTFEDWNHLTHVKQPIFITLDDGYSNNLQVWDIFNGF